MAKQEFNGKTLDEALSAAARAFGTDVNLLSYNILPQNSGGLFSKLFQRGVRLEAWIDSSNDVQAAAREAVRQARADAQSDQTTKGPRQQQAGRPARGEDTRPKQGQRKNNADAPRPRNQDQQNGKHARPQTSGASARTAQLDLPVKRRVEESESDRAPRNKIDLNSDASKDLLKELAIQFVRGFDPDLDPGTVDIEFGSNEDVTVTVQSPNLESFLIRTDRLSCAFEHLFKRIAQRRFGDVSGRITLNAGSANQQREEKLKQLALDVASKVKENGKTITLSSKSSQERRVIHLALEHMDGIATKSIGVGENRKLVIYSTTRPPREKGNRRHSTHGQRQHDGRPRHQSLESKSNNQITDADGEVSFANQQGESGERTPPRRNRRRGRRGGSRPQQLRSDDRSADEGPKAIVKDTPHQPPHENEV
jgi:predicted RNA-binding protein Jag